MTEAVYGVIGVVLGVLLGGTGKYWSLRRDAWKDARAAGLLLLADVRALCAAGPADAIGRETQLGVKTWEAHRTVLATFRRGRFPNGLKAPGWLDLAGHFARLKQLDADRAGPDQDASWWEAVQTELRQAESLLAAFERDPWVFVYVVTPVPRG